MYIKAFEVNPFSENTYLIYDDTKEAIVVDPGFFSPHEQANFLNFLKENKLNLVQSINTHCHIDHVFAWEFIYDKFGLKPTFHQNDLALLKTINEQAKLFGISWQLGNIPYNKHIEVSSKISFGNTNLDVLFCPGHAPGHVVFHEPKSNVCLVGDVIFRQSIGRTDLPFCNPAHLEKSIQEVIYKLPSDCTLFPGHGPTTTVGHEMTSNPFVRPKDRERKT